MRTLFALLTAVGVLLASPAAQASPHHGYHPVAPAPGGVSLDNDSGVAIDLYIDGAWRGEVARGDTRTFSTLAGRRQVVVRAHDLGVVLFDDRMTLQSGRPVPVRIVPPTTRVTLKNQGGAPLYASMAGVQGGVWLLPGGHHTLEVAGFQAVVTSSLYTRYGLTPVDADVLRLTPGRAMVHSLGFTAVAPNSQLSVTNHERRTVRVFIGGQEVVAIPPRSTRSFETTAGRHMVTVAEDGGRILYNQAADFTPNSRHTIELRDGVHIATEPGRPLGLGHGGYVAAR